jgi:threonine dehydrogenase-like Zn-dependent dehydrogenase
LVYVSNLQDNPVIKLPDGLSPQEAVFARLAAISMTSLHQSRIHTGDTVVVLGMGLIGNLAAQLFALQGAVVAAVDVEPGRLDIARSVGLARTVLSAEGVNTKEAVRDCLGVEPDIVVEATGVPALANEALELVRKRGQVVLLGSPRGTVVMKIYEHIHSKGVFLTGAHENMQKLPGVPNRGKTTAYVLDLISKGNLRVASLMTHCIPYGKAEEAYDMLLNK